MSAVPSNIQPLPKDSAPNGIAFITGKIRSRRTYKTQAGLVHCTVLSLPAVDEFTAPSVVEVESTGQLGQEGDVVKLKVQISGRSRGYTTKDGEQVRTAELRLRVVQ